MIVSMSVVDCDECASLIVNDCGKNKKA